MNESMVTLYVVIFGLIVTLFARSIVKMFTAAHNITVKKRSNIRIEDSDKIAFIDAKTNFSLHFIFLLGFIIAMVILKTHIIPGL